MPPIDLSAPPRRAEIPTLVQTLASVLGRNHERLVSLFSADFARDPSLTIANSVVARARGRIVANVTVYDKPLRLGAATVPTGCIGNVACLPEYRGKGLAGACMRGSLELMRRRGLPLALLFGIEGYYARFGFVGCLPPWKLTLQTGDLRGLRSPLRPVPYRARDLPELMRIERAASGDLPLTVVRDAARWRYALERNQVLGGDEPALMTFRDRRAIRAYALWKDGWLWESGMAHGDDQAAVAVLAWVRDRRIAALEKTLTLDNCAPAHPLWLHATRYNHALSAGLRYSGGGMGMIVDVAAFLGLLRREFIARAMRAGIDGGFTLSLRVDGQAHLVESPGTRPRRARLTCRQQDLLLLSIGARSIDELPRVRASGDGSLLRALFPPGSPAFHKLDHF